MNIDAVIAQIKLCAPVFAGNVAGAADYALAAGDQVWLPRPAAYVIPLHDEAEPNTQQNGVRQLIREKVGVIVDLDNSADRRGQAAATIAVADIRAGLFRSLINWRSDPTTQSRGFAYDGGGLLNDAITRAFVRWQFDFVVETLMTDCDGWQPPAEPLAISTAYPPLPQPFPIQFPPT